VTDQNEFIFDKAEEAARVAAKSAAAAPESDDMNLGQGPLRKLVDSNFLQYASYVICDRAIPSLEDGLKPVQRRILHALHDKDDGRFIKVANVVGHTMQYHPHGDASIADALVNLTNKTYLIEGQGNFGNIFTGDRAAASRYIECRLTELAREEIFNKDLTRFIPSYDGRNKEPVTLPCKLPLLLMLGAEGIAVGMSTRILPHNFIELLEAQIAIIQKKTFKLFPDFPLGGLMDVSDYDKGVGKIKIRAVMEKRADGALVVRELPFGVTSESLISSIEDAVRGNKVPVKSITDFTSEAVEIELTLQADANPDKAIKALYAFTSCETSVSSRALVISNNRPVEMTIDEILKANTKRLLDLLKKELKHRKSSLLEDFHGKTLVQIFIENRIYKRIEECKTVDEVHQAVMAGLDPFAGKLNRAITKSDIEMLLAVRI
jgi:topoisomerase-4 subunit A